MLVGLKIFLKCANILICRLCGGSINVYAAEVVVFFSIKFELCVHILVCSLTMKSRKGLPQDLHGICATHTDLILDVTDTDC